MLDLDLLRGLLKKRESEALPILPVTRSVLDCHSHLFGHSVVRHSVETAAETVVFVGNCIGEGIASGLSASDRASSRFRFTVIPLHLKSLSDQDSLAALSAASYVFVQQLGGVDWELINSVVMPYCKTFQYPGLVLNDLWPFDQVSGYDDEAARAQPEGNVRHFDGALAKLRKAEPDKKKRIARYTALNFDGAKRIISTAVAQKQFLQDIDTRSDCHIGRFIERNRRDRQLFYNASHPSELVFQELCEWCWRKLGLEDNPPKFAEIDGWKNWSVPVHPAIARHVGAVWAHEATRYTYVTLGEITWKEWVEVYVDTFG